MKVMVYDDGDDGDDDVDAKAMGGSGGYCQSWRVSALLAPSPIHAHSLAHDENDDDGDYDDDDDDDGDDDEDEKIGAPKLC